LKVPASDDTVQRPAGDTVQAPPSENAVQWEEDDLLASAPALPATFNGAAFAGVDVPRAQRVYPNLEAWVAGWFVRTFARYPGPDRRWCARWWDHPEAIHRLEDLWRSWEALRLKEDLGMSTWLREHLDPQRDRLMAEGGPFHSCDKDNHELPPDLAAVPAPAGWWEMTAEQRRDYR